MSNNTAVKASAASGAMIDITIPSDQREGNQASVNRWLKKVGEFVKKNDPLLEVNTDKVTLEIVAPVSGVLSEILKEPKAAVELSDIFGRMSPMEAAPQITPVEPLVSTLDGLRSNQSGSAHAPAPSSSRNSPAVRGLAAQHQLNLSTIAGSGTHGRVTARDVERQIATASTSGPISKPPSIALPTTKLESRSITHTPMRKAIAAEMAKSVATAPHVTSVFEVDFDALLAHRAQTRELFAKRGVKLTVTPYLLWAIHKAIEMVPEVNSSWHAEHLALHGDVNIGVATALESSQGGGAGLVVPVVKNVTGRSLFSLAQELGRVTDTARSGKLSAADVSGGTFTISNHGMSGSLVASPIIILQPQVAILGVGKLERRLVVSEINGREIFEARSRAYVTLTIDHRALDGFSANKFLTTFSDALSEDGLRSLVIG